MIEVCPVCGCGCDIVHTATLCSDNEAAELVVEIIDWYGKIMYYNSVIDGEETENLRAYCNACGSNIAGDLYMEVRERTK